MHPVYDQLLTDVRAACEAHYGSRLTALAVFGSVERGTPQPDSDVDLPASGRRRDARAQPEVHAHVAARLGAR